MHLTKLTLHPENYPTKDIYPFNLQVFNVTRELELTTPVTFFIGENGTGKSTLLKAITLKCSYPIWRNEERRHFKNNKHAEALQRYLELEWTEGAVPGSYFATEIFQTFAQALDEWAVSDPGIFKYFGGDSLLTKSHGQCHLAYFKSRYALKGLHLLDEPETALSPRSQLELLELLQKMAQASHAQFIIATHSPLLLALPGATIYSFDHAPVRQVEYEETDYYRVYRDFLNERERYLKR